MTYLPATQEQEPDKVEEANVISRLPSWVAEPAKAIPSSVHDMSESELAKAAQPDITAERLRVAFWGEYDRACKTDTMMSMTNVYAGVCTKRYFENVVNNSFKLRYLCTLPIDYEVGLAEATNYGLLKMREILALPVKDADGKVDSKLIQQQREIWMQVQERHKGSIIKRFDINTKKQSVNLNLNQHAGSQPPRPQTLEELRNQLAELEGDTPATIEHEAKSVDVEAMRVADEEKV